MAIRELAPKALPKTPQRTTSAEKVRLRLITAKDLVNVKSITSKDRDQKSFLTICLLIATTGLLTMFALNIALTQGAFKVKALKIEVIEINELREAALSNVARISAPEVLASSATKLGMIPSSKPYFITLNEVKD
jgi:hypothetical protein